MPRLTLRRVLFIFFGVLIISFYFYATFIFFENQKTEKKKPIPSGRKIFKKIPATAETKLKFYKIDNHAYALAAFTDDRNGNMGYKFVRILVAIERKDEFECFINDEKSREVNFYEFSENHGSTMKTFIINCRVPEAENFDSIHSVKLSRAHSGKSTEIPISYRISDDKTSQKKEKPAKMSVCVPTLFGNSYDARRIVEFVELNSLLGIERIFLYHDPSVMKDEKMKKTLQYYADNHIVQLIEFKLPFAEKDIWYHGQLLTITECLLRNTGVTQYTFFNDIDEFFIPMSNLSLFDTLSQLFDDPLIGSRRTALKYMSIKSNVPPITINNVVTDKRMENRFTKCVIRPELVFEQGIHHTSRVIQDNYKIEEHDGSLLRVHHFKPPKYCCQSETTIKDKYSISLKKQFDFVVKFLNI